MSADRVTERSEGSNPYFGPISLMDGYQANLYLLLTLDNNRDARFQSAHCALASKFFDQIVDLTTQQRYLISPYTDHDLSRSKIRESIDQPDPWGGRFGGKIVSYILSREDNQKQVVSALIAKNRPKLGCYIDWEVTHPDHQHKGLRHRLMKEVVTFYHHVSTYTWRTSTVTCDYIPYDDRYNSDQRIKFQELHSKLQAGYKEGLNQDWWNGLTQEEQNEIKHICTNHYCLKLLGLNLVTHKAGDKGFFAQFEPFNYLYIEDNYSQQWVSFLKDLQSRHSYEKREELEARRLVTLEYITKLNATFIPRLESGDKEAIREIEQLAFTKGELLAKLYEEEVQKEQDDRTSPSNAPFYMKPESFGYTLDTKGEERIAQLSELLKTVLGFDPQKKAAEIHQASLEPLMPDFEPHRKDFEKYLPPEWT